MNSEFSADEQNNLNIILDKLSNGEKVKLKVLITEYFDSDSLDRQFVYNFSPRLSLIGESDTLTDAQDQCMKGLKFLLDKEANDRGITYNFDDIEIEMKVYY